MDWIPCEERLPEMNDEVVVRLSPEGRDFLLRSHWLNEVDEVTSATFAPSQFFFPECYCWEVFREGATQKARPRDVTHWMPMPDPPKAESEGGGKPVWRILFTARWDEDNGRYVEMVWELNGKEVFRNNSHRVDFEEFAEGIHRLNSCMNHNLLPGISPNVFAWMDDRHMDEMIREGKVYANIGTAGQETPERQ